MPTTAGTWPAVWGVDPESLPGKGVPAVELLARLGAEVRALMVHGSNPVVSAPDATAVRRRLTELDLLVVCDFVPQRDRRARRRRAARDPVGRGGGHDDQPRGPGAASASAARAGRRWSRSELEILAELAELARQPRDARPRPGGRLRRAGPRQRRWACRLLGSEPRGSRRESPRFWPVAPSSRHHGCSPRPSPTPTASPGWCPSRRVVPADDLRADAPVYLVTGRVLAQYQSGAQTRRVPSLNRTAPRVVRRAAPPARAPARHRGRRRPSMSPPPAATRRRRPGSPGTSGRTPCSCRSTGAARPRSTRSPTTRVTRSPGCRSSRCARSLWPVRSWAAHHRR